MLGRDNLVQLDVFLAVVSAGSFTRAATARGVSGSAVSHAIRGLEERLGVRLFHRTSRTLRLTAAGEQLAAELVPRFEEIDEAVEKLGRFRESPRGRVRITTLRDAARLLIAPKLPAFVARYPDVEVEISVEDRMVDMVAEGFDAGIRYGGTVPEGMVASKLTKPLEWVVVGAPSYFKKHGRPEVPQDLLRHRCIRIRTGAQRVYRWELGDGPRAVELDVPGTVTLGDSELSISAAVAGVGLFYCLRARVEQELTEGTLEVVLLEWSSLGPGFCAYYASHRQVPSALRAFLNHLKA
ncbi:LysR family transcriptional regulator [Archangium gephyra]|nr:LysR family transcriptional regulator [Archangium gephyra]